MNVRANKGVRTRVIVCTLFFVMHNMCGALLFNTAANPEFPCCEDDSTLHLVLLLFLCLAQ